MLYLHCGFPKTGTTSLQEALFAHRDRMAAEGMLYPEEWMLKKDHTHFGLTELVSASKESADALDGLKELLSANADRNVLLSCEALTVSLAVEENLRALLNFFAVAESVVPTKCIWTLRRFDEVMHSFYLRSMAGGREQPPPTGVFERIDFLPALFAGLRAVEDAVVRDVVYVKYEPSGDHSEALLRALGVPNGAQGAIREQLQGGARMNVGLTHKAAVVLANLDGVSQRTGTDFDEARLRDLFYLRELRFEHDWACQLVDADTRRDLHERALAAAEQNGVDSYRSFFDDAEIRESPDPVGLDPDILTDEDLEKLARA